MPASKICFKCNHSQPLTEFYKHPKMGDGHLNKCKTCTKKDVTENYHNNHEHYRQYDKYRETLDYRKANKANYLRKYRSTHPDRNKARAIVNRAVSSGKLKKLQCSICSSETNVQAHHHDYSKPLEVIWLCNSCHWDHHNHERNNHYEDKASDE